MKNLVTLFTLSLSLVLASCSGDEEGSELTAENLEGKWKITAFEAEEGNDRVEFQECEKTLVYEFTTKEAEKLSDGTETMELIVTNPEQCEVFFARGEGWETVYGMAGSRLYIKNLYMAGTSFSGGFKVKEFDGKKLVLQLFKHTVTFEKV